MPTYQYACTACDHRFDAVQSFSDASLTVCPECGGALRKVFSSVGIVFKGSGFYRTDSRSSAGSAVAKSEPGSTPSEKSTTPEKTPASTTSSSSEKSSSTSTSTPAAAAS